MPLLQLDNLVRIRKLKAEPPAKAEFDLDIDPELLDALLRVAREVYRRASALASIKGS